MDELGYMVNLLENTLDNMSKILLKKWKNQGLTEKQITEKINQLEEKQNDRRVKKRA